jgi:hypothetical protein
VAGTRPTLIATRASSQGTGHRSVIDAMSPRQRGSQRPYLARSGQASVIATEPIACNRRCSLIR